MDFSLDGQNGLSEMVVDVSNDDRYSIRLDYHYNAADKSARQTLWREVGGLQLVSSGKAVEIGAPFDVSILIKETSSGKVVHESISKTPKLSSWGEGVLHAEIADLFLKSGRYRLLVRREGAVANIKSSRTTITFIKAFYGK
ncbi:DUF5625 family protein [Pseudomonas sp. OA65]|uniref:DUF5625 family protein n=1 Tax=Pseudomonas sp. OA65 TaxID=2818431 RepID=UPI001A9ED379|nr:DUF5625 family protein [Pseudomonas sp. OA65]MBO1537002.1 hypothetical protein [Pseudomonas sp. OA65]